MPSPSYGTYSWSPSFFWDPLPTPIPPTPHPPLVVDAVGTRRYCDSFGNLHREDGPAVEYANGNKEWCINGMYHREDGPAIDRVAHREWWIQGRRHREDGPAIERTTGRQEWYLKGRRVDVLTQDQFARMMHADKYL